MEDRVRGPSHRSHHMGGVTDFLVMEKKKTRKKKELAPCVESPWNNDKQASLPESSRQFSQQRVNNGTDRSLCPPRVSRGRCPSRLSDPSNDFRAAFFGTGTPARPASCSTPTSPSIFFVPAPRRKRFRRFRERTACIVFINNARAQKYNRGISGEHRLESAEIYKMLIERYEKKNDRV